MSFIFDYLNSAAQGDAGNQSIILKIFLFNESA
jgi:hypothetical protein